MRFSHFVSGLGPEHVSPVEGTGLKIKVVEALAHGRPVFGSQHSCDGLPPGATGAVFPLEIAEIKSIIDDAERLAVAERAAEAFYRTLFPAGDIGKLRGFICDLLTGR